MDEPSLSEHEQRILEEIERNLAAEDPDFARKVRSSSSARGGSNIMRLGILGLIVGFALLLAYTVHTALGVLGFLVMLAGAVAVGSSVRSIATNRTPSSKMREAWKKAEGRMKFKRRDR